MRAGFPPEAFGPLARRRSPVGLRCMIQRRKGGRAVRLIACLPNHSLSLYVPICPSIHLSTYVHSPLTHSLNRSSLPIPSFLSGRHCRFGADRGSTGERREGALPALGSPPLTRRSRLRQRPRRRRGEPRSAAGGCSSRPPGPPSSAPCFQGRCPRPGPSTPQSPSALAETASSGVRSSAAQPLRPAADESTQPANFLSCFVLTSILHLALLPAQALPLPEQRLLHPVHLVGHPF